MKRADYDIRNSKRIKIDTRIIRVDRLMANIIRAVNHSPFKTLGCCSGHGRYPMTIVVQDALGISELVSGKTIPRKRRFYVKDKEGFYYIPETIKK